MQVLNSVRHYYLTGDGDDLFMPDEVEERDELQVAGCLPAKSDAALDEGGIVFRESQIKQRIRQITFQVFRGWKILFRP